LILRGGGRERRDNVAGLIFGLVKTCGTITGVVDTVAVDNSLSSLRTCDYIRKKSINGSVMSFFYFAVMIP
jgi:hypothetical protein